MQFLKGAVTYAPNYYATEHFMHSDFICPCCDMLKLVPAFYSHVSLLERLRMELELPIIVTSGYRCKNHNLTVGGAPRSWHLLFATDIKPENANEEILEAMYSMAIDLGFGGIGKYGSYLHLDMRPEKLRWRG